MQTSIKVKDDILLQHMKNRITDPAKASYIGVGEDEGGVFCDVCSIFYSTLLQ
jgi:hypothetical protein